MINMDKMLKKVLADLAEAKAGGNPQD